MTMRTKQPWPEPTRVVGQPAPGLHSGGHSHAVQCHQTLDRGLLHQSIELRRPGGTVWTAHARTLPLPTEATGQARMIRDATVVLGLAAAAILATEQAREARAFGIDQRITAAELGRLPQPSERIARGS